MTRVNICKEAFEQLTAGVEDYTPTTKSFGTIHHYFLSDKCMVVWVDKTAVGKGHKYELVNFEH